MFGKSKQQSTLAEEIDHRRVESAIKIQSVHRGQRSRRHATSLRSGLQSGGLAGLALDLGEQSPEVEHGLPLSARGEGVLEDILKGLAGDDEDSLSHELAETRAVIQIQALQRGRRARLASSRVERVSSGTTEPAPLSARGESFIQDILKNLSGDLESTVSQDGAFSDDEDGRSYSEHSPDAASRYVHALSNTISARAEHTNAFMTTILETVQAAEASAAAAHRVVGESPSSNREQTLRSLEAGIEATRARADQIVTSIHDTLLHNRHSTSSEPRWR